MRIVTRVWKRRNILTLQLRLAHVQIRSAQKTGNHKNAVVSASTVLDVDGLKLRTLKDCVRVSESLGRDKEALHYQQEILALDSSTENLLEASRLAEGVDDDFALFALKQCMDPDDPELLFRRADILFNLSKYREALIDVDKILKGDLDDNMKQDSMKLRRRIRHELSLEKPTK